ncbi:MAG TPA: rod shape-determining protein MreD [Planctomicrobium sp.]|nr:rod shape-determining protein MreD [Planctomicrobium sp.]
MLLRITGIGVLTFVALLIDSALPVWLGGFAMLPSLLDLALVTVCLKLNGGEAVFWGGVIGLLQDDLTGKTLGVGMMIGASLALICPMVFRSSGSQQTWIDRLLLSALLLVILGICRIGWRWISGTVSDSELLISAQISAQMGQLAATFLLLVIWQAIEAIVIAGNASRRQLHESSF